MPPKETGERRRVLLRLLLMVVCGLAALVLAGYYFLRRDASLFDGFLLALAAALLLGRVVAHSRRRALLALRLPKQASKLTASPEEIDDLRRPTQSAASASDRVLDGELVYRDGSFVPSHPLPLQSGTVVRFSVVTMARPPEQRQRVGRDSLLAARERAHEFGAGSRSRRDEGAGAQPEPATLPATALQSVYPASTRRPLLAFDIHWGLTAAAIVLSIGLLSSLSGRQTRHEETGPVISWLLSCALMVAAWAPLPSLQAIGSCLLARRRETAAITALALFALVVRICALDSVPYTLSGDEGSIGLELRRILDGSLKNPFGLGWGPVPTMAYFFEVPVAAIYGLSPLTLRLGIAPAGALAVVALYGLARQLFNARVALGAGAILAGYHFHLHYSRVAVHQIFDTFFFSATLAAVIFGLRDPRRAWCFLLAGILAGLDQYTYTGSRLLPVLLALFVGFLALRRSVWLMNQGRNLIVMTLSFLVVAGPILLLALEHPSDFNARINQVGIVQSGWFEREQAARGTGPLPILQEQFQRTLLGFAIYADRTEAYLPGGPLASPLMATFLFIGIGAALLRGRRPEYLLINVWFWMGLVFGGVLTVDPPTSNRLVSITPAVALLTACGVAELARLTLAAFRGRTAQYEAIAIAAVALAIVVTDVRFYFGDFASSHRYGGGHALIATLIGYELRDSPVPTRLYFFGAPRMFSGFSSLVFLAPEVERVDVAQRLQKSSDLERLVTPGKDAVFIFLPDRAPEVELVASRYPSGLRKDIWAPDGSSILYYQYKVPRDALDS